jgi:carboxymethylenebutenolidase
MHRCVLATAVSLVLLCTTATLWAQEKPGDTGLTGILSEEEFKALHQLTAEKTPPLQGQMIEIAGSKAYLSLPADAKPPLPGIVVIHEWWGLNDNIKHWSDRLAADGYAALAVDLYGGKVATTRDEAMASMRAVEEEPALEILHAAHAFLAEDERIQATRRASIGWCFGGGWSLQQALTLPDLDAAVIYYGRLVTDPERLAAIRAPLLGIFGNKDQGIPPEVVDEFAKALEKAKIEHNILRYDAEHAFANPSNAHYDEKSAAAAWTEVRAFLRANLKQAK